MSTRGILISCLSLGLACSSPPARTTTTPPPVVQSTDLTADGKHFATERTYEGDCMPAGTRGGCHTITLRPDGSYRNFLFDAAVLGTYEISGNEVALHGSDASMPVEKLTLSADHNKLGELALKP